MQRGRKRVEEGGKGVSQYFDNCSVKTDEAVANRRRARSRPDTISAFVFNPFVAPLSPNPPTSPSPSSSSSRQFRLRGPVGFTMPGLAQREMIGPPPINRGEGEGERGGGENRGTRRAPDSVARMSRAGEPDKWHGDAVAVADAASWPRTTSSPRRTCGRETRRRMTPRFTDPGEFPGTESPPSINGGDRRKQTREKSFRRRERYRGARDTKSVKLAS